jgi:dTDP-4-dehydrorhamnose reductase
MFMTLVLTIGQVPNEDNAAAPAIAVDYTNISQLTRVLEENNVHTVISTIMMYDPVAAQAERNLVAAADQALSTKRFVASNWGTAEADDE